MTGSCPVRVAELRAVQPVWSGRVHLIAGQAERCLCGASRMGIVHEVGEVTCQRCAAIAGLGHADRSERLAIP